MHDCCDFCSTESGSQILGYIAHSCLSTYYIYKLITNNIVNSTLNEKFFLTLYTFFLNN